MTLHSEDRTDQVPRRPLNGHVTAVPTAQLLLDSVCRSATELARSTPHPPCRIKLRYGQTSVEVEWPAGEPAGAADRADPPAAPARSVPADRAAPAGPRAAAGAEPGAPHYVCAPTVGTFYHSPEPGAPPFVRVGDLVRAGQPVGVLEVMKMMSTIEADATGRVVEIAAPNAQAVEFQQRLIAIDVQRPEDVREAEQEG